MDGTLIGYYDNGELMNIDPYENGEMHGYSKFFFKNGKLSSAGNYKLGNKEGPWKYYNYDEKIYSHGEFQSGKKERLWEYFDELGSLKKSVIYRNGEVIDKQTWTILTLST